MPEVHPHYIWLWRGFEVLSGQRQYHGNGPQPIAISEIAAYADYVGMADEADREDFLHIITVLDSIVLDYTGQEQAKVRRDMEKKSKAQSRSTRKRR